MIELQKLINKWKQEAALLSKEYCVKGLTDFKDGAKGQLRICIRDAELLLSDKNTGAITESAHLANTVLGEVCPHCRKLITTESSGAGSGETGDVGQNLGDFEPLIKGESPCDWDW